MQWRLLLDGAASGAWNMAVDEALLWSQAKVEAHPTLRFYDWQPACLSLGRFQKDVSHHLPVDVVRRPTGGRAVWHEQEVTYCAVFRADLLPAGSTSVIGAYRWLTSGFLAGLRHLGIEASLSAHAPKREERSANCFLAAAQCDTVVDGKKLIGAAQCRKTIDGQLVVLQHGSLLLDIDPIAWSLALEGTSGDRAMSEVASLKALGVQASRQQVIEALCRGVEAELGASFRLEALSQSEQVLAQRLHNGKYTQPSWNREGREVNLTGAALSSEAVSA